MDTSEFKEVFAAEARDYIQTLNENLLALETNPEDGELLDEMFRAAHSLKGMSGTMGFHAMAEFTHHMENVLDMVRTDQLELTTSVADTIFQCVDTLEVLLEQTLTDEELVDTAPLIKALRDLETSQEESRSEETPKTDQTPNVDSPSSGETYLRFDTNDKLVLDEFDKETVRQGLEQGFRGSRISVRLKPNTLLKSVRVYTVFQALEGVGTIIKCFPSTQELEEENFDREFSLLLLSQEDAAQVQDLVENISEIETVHIETLRSDDLTESEQRRLDQDISVTPLSDDASLKSEKVESSRAMAAETVPGVEEENTPSTDPKKQSSDSKGSTGKSRTSNGKSRLADKFVRVETDLLDKLIDLVGELVINRTQVMEMGKAMDGSHEKATIGQLDRITTDLQYATMKLRMVPIKQVFDLEIYGADTELDRSIVNQIGDPLVHLIRNSVDHGIESREARRRAGKTEHGTLRLGARHEGSHVLIELADDGQGINVDRIREKAIERGLLPKDHTGTISVQEAVRLLFEPGFSTADSVSDISGRGVGMDAVKAVVESMSGTVDMQSTPGQGSKTTIKLPLTLAIIKALLVKSSDETFAIPIQAVRENLLVGNEQIKTVQQQEVIVLRNEVLPLFDLAECLGWPRTPRNGDSSVIVVEVSGEKLGFIVDELIGQQEIVIKSLGDLLGDIKGIAGATVLGNGRVALILDNSTLTK